MRCGFDDIPTVRFGEIFRNGKTYGVVRRGFLRCREPYGAVRCYLMSYGAVRFGFQCGESYGSARFRWHSRGAVRCGFPIAVFRYHKTYGAVRCGFKRFFKRANLQRCVCGAVNRTEPHRTVGGKRTVKNPVKWQ